MDKKMQQAIAIAQYSEANFEQTLHTVGAFSWWYIDLTDGEGNGLVLVWAYGLPFLPGSRLPQSARSRPALHLAKYSGGAPVFYLLQRFLAEEASIGHDGHGSLGACRFHLDESEHHIKLTAHLNLEIPGSRHRLTGDVRIAGPKAVLPGTDDSSHHVWSPRCAAAQGQAVLDYDGDVHKVEGSAYFDSNLSRVPLHEQHIESWRWGRISFGDETLVYYDISSHTGDRTTLVFTQKEGSELRLIHVLPTFSVERRGRFGLSGPRQVDLETPAAHYRITLDRLVDDGPFYQRYLVSGNRTNGSLGRETVTRGHGMAELVHPSKVDIPWQRPFVSMKTHHIGARNSLLLPFFSGFRHDRAKRTLGGFMQQMRSL